MLNLAGLRVDPSSDYPLAKVLNVPEPTLIGWHKGRSKPEPLTMARFARLYGIDARLALLQLQVERSRDRQERELCTAVADVFESSDITLPDEASPEIWRRIGQYVAVDDFAAMAAAELEPEPLRAI